LSAKETVGDLLAMEGDRVDAFLWYHFERMGALARGRQSNVHD
jgi:hypothetical protein